MVFGQRGLFNFFGIRLCFTVAFTFLNLFFRILFQLSFWLIFSFVVTS